MYQYNGFIDRLKRRLGQRDGHLICNDCKKPFFNLCPSVVCYPCWSKPTDGSKCKLCDSPEHRACDCPKIGGYAITQGERS